MLVWVVETHIWQYVAARLKYIGSGGRTRKYGYGDTTPCVVPQPAQVPRYLERHTDHCLCGDRLGRTEFFSCRSVCAFASKYPPPGPTHVPGKNDAWKERNQTGTRVILTVALALSGRSESCC